MIYLDNAASTAVRPEVLDEMMQILSKQYGNPSSIHGYGRAAEKTINIARRDVAALIGSLPGEILFTSGGTESNNMAIHGVMKGTGHIVTTSIEHDAVLEPCRMLEKSGHTVTYVTPDKSGIIDVQITEKTQLVSVMLANNEIGTIQPIEQISQECRNQGILLHTPSCSFLCRNPACSTESSNARNVLCTRAHAIFLPSSQNNRIKFYTFSYVKCSNTLGAVYFMRGY